MKLRKHLNTWKREMRKIFLSAKCVHLIIFLSFDRFLNKLCSLESKFIIVPVPWNTVQKKNESMEQSQWKFSLSFFHRSSSLYPRTRKNLRPRGDTVQLRLVNWFRRKPSLTATNWWDCMLRSGVCFPNFKTSELLSKRVRVYILRKE